MKHLLAVAIILAALSGSHAQNNDLNPDWKSFHTTAATHQLLNGWAKAYPNLTRLYSIGETLKGTPLMMLEITNKQTGAAEDKPAYYYDGNIHSGELTGAEVALYFAWHLLTKYESDPRIKALLDTRTIYIRPKFNPETALT